MKTMILTILATLSIQSANCQTLQGGVQQSDVQLNGQNGQFGGQVQQPAFNVRARQSAPPVLEVTEPNHGDVWYGCLGAQVDNATGKFVTIFPESDLNRFGVRIGDEVVAINGKPFDPPMFVAECRGIPGTPVTLQLASGRIVTPNRVDSRALAHNHSYYQQWSRPISRW